MSKTKYRFYVPENYYKNQEIRLEKGKSTEFKHLNNVLRLKVGQIVELFNGKGQKAKAQIISLNAQTVVFSLHQPSQLPPPALNIALCQSPLKGSRMDWLLEKSTELGISTFQSVLSEHTELSAKDCQKKQIRWQKLTLAALKQSGNAYLPEFKEALKLRDYLQQENQANIKLFGTLAPKAPQLLKYLQSIPLPPPLRSSH